MRRLFPLALLVGCAARELSGPVLVADKYLRGFWVSPELRHWAAAVRDGGAWTLLYDGEPLGRADSIWGVLLRERGPLWLEERAGGVYVMPKGLGPYRKVLGLVASRDGSLVGFSYIDWNGKLWVRMGDEGYGPYGEVVGLGVSREGSRWVVAARDPGAREYKVIVNGVVEGVFSSPPLVAVDGGVAWAGDGRVFVNGREVARFQEVQSLALVDGEAWCLARDEGGFGLFRGNRRVSDAIPSAGLVAGFTLSPDKRHWAAVVQVEVLSPEGKGLELALEVDGDYRKTYPELGPFRFSPDSRLLVYTVPREGAWEVVARELDAGRERSLGRYRRVFGLDFRGEKLGLCVLDGRLVKFLWVEID